MGIRLGGVSWVSCGVQLSGILDISAGEAVSYLFSYVFQHCFSGGRYITQVEQPFGANAACTVENGDNPFCSDINPT